MRAVWNSPAILLLALTAGACAPERWPAESPWEPADSLAVEVRGQDFVWHYRFPGRDGVLDTQDDIRASGPLHLPVGIDVELRLTSDDYVYQLELPHLDLREIAVPELLYTLEFSTEREGRFELRGDQFCGYTHDSLITELVVESAEAFQSWLGKASRAG